MAAPVDDRDRARRLPTDHRHQCDHLLRRPDLRGRRLYLAIIADDGDHLGDRRCQRARTLIAIAFIDRLGRRKLLLAGLIGMGPAWRWSGSPSSSLQRPPPAPPRHGPSGAGIVTLFALVAFIICFAFSMGPVTWTVINEVFPGHIRGRAVAVATAVNWGSAFLVSQSFLSLIEAMGNSWTFWLFALFCGVAWMWIYLPCAGDKRTVSGTDPTALEGAVVRAAERRGRFTSSRRGEEHVSIPRHLIGKTRVVPLKNS